MDLEINTLFYREENEELEYKGNYGKDTIAETMAAFATSQGGYILIGVKNNGEPIGIPIDSCDEIKKNIYDISKNITGGRISIKIDFSDFGGGKKIVLIRVNEGNEKPYGWKGAYYKRVGSSDEKLEPDEIAEIRLASKQLSFDSLSGRVYDRVAHISDIDEEKLKRYIEFVNTGKRNRKIFFDNVQKTLQNLDLLNKKMEVKNASLLFFGKEPQKAFPQSRINFLMYGGDTINGSALRSKKVLEDSLLNQIENAFDLIKINTENRIIMKKLRRIEINQYPLDAIREAVINAVAHRDYTIGESNIIIRLFENRLEIINPGGLMKGVNLEELKKGGHPSYRRNPIICKLLDDVGYMEQSGQGIKNMIISMKNYGLEEPSISAEKDFFKIEFLGQKIKPNGSGRIRPLVGKSTNLEPLLTTLGQKGLSYIQNMPENFITIGKYMEKLGVKSRLTAKSHLDKFKEFGILKSEKVGRERIYRKQI